jgi:hypothetical protein
VYVNVHFNPCTNYYENKQQAYKHCARNLAIKSRLKQSRIILFCVLRISVTTFVQSQANATYYIDIIKYGWLK